MEENNNMNLNMKEEKSNKNIILIVIIIILSILLLGLTYCTFFVKEKCVNIKDDDNNLSTNENVNNKMEVNTENGKLTIEKSKDSVTFNSMKYAISGELLGNVILDSSKGYVYLVNARVESDEIGLKIGKKTIYEYDDKYHPYPENLTKYDGYRLDAQNIVSAYIFSKGNGGISYDIILIDKNLKASILSLTGDYNKNAITDAVYYNNIMNNIISAEKVFSSNGDNYNLIDINGNKYSIY